MFRLCPTLAVFPNQSGSSNHDKAVRHWGKWCNTLFYVVIAKAGLNLVVVTGLRPVGSPDKINSSFNYISFLHRYKSVRRDILGFLLSGIRRKYLRKSGAPSAPGFSRGPFVGNAKEMLFEIGNQEFDSVQILY